MISWRDRGRGTTGAESGNNISTDNEVNLPLGPGEWNEALGLPLCVVCQNVSDSKCCIISMVVESITKIAF